MMKYLISFIAILATSCTARIATTAVLMISPTASQTPSLYHIPTLVPAPPHAVPSPFPSPKTTPSSPAPSSHVSPTTPASSKSLSPAPSPQSADVPISGNFAEGWINRAVTVGTVLAGVVFVSVALI
nr:hypothetical protein [Tanacetum cinerariifolium]